MDSRPTKRYSSPLRRTQVELTHQTIMEAMAVVVVEGGDGDTVKRVARQANVSERTIYRHFTSKQSLWDAFLLWVSERVGLSTYPASCEEMVEIVPQVFAAFDENADLLRACLAEQAWSDVWLAGRSGWRESILRCLEASFDGLDEQTKDHAAALVHLIFNGINWKTMRDQWGLDGPTAGRITQWSLAVLFKDLKTRGRVELSPGDLPLFQ